MAVVPLNPKPRKPRESLKREPKGVRVTPEALARARLTAARQHARKVFEVSAEQFPPGVIPKFKKDDENASPILAMDQSILEVSGWATEGLAVTGPYASAFAEGTTFLGYAYLSELAQRAEYRVISETIAEEMTREWIEFKSTDDEDKSAKIKELEDAIHRYRVRDAFRKLAETDGFFGRAHLYIDLKGAVDDAEELKTSIGNGRDEISKEKVQKGDLVAIRCVEPVWTYPTRYDSINPLKPDWYKPTMWFVMGQELHHTRLLIFVGREVPDLLKPTYSFGGLSMSQMAKPYIDNWLRTRQSVSDILHSFSVMGLKTNLATSLQPGGEQVFMRAELFNLARDNQSIMLIDKDTEDFFVASAPLGGLEGLQAQTQEHMAAVARIPLVKLLGIQPTGLNASSEGEIRTFYDNINAYQEKLFRAPLTRVIDFIQLSEFGEVDETITFEFKSLWRPDEAGHVAIQKTKADTHEAYMSMNVVTGEEVRRALVADKDSPYQGLDLDPNALPEQIEGFGEAGETEAEGEGGSEEGREAEPARKPTPRDPPDRLASSITNKAANFGGATSGGFSAHDMALDEDYDAEVRSLIDVCEDWIAYDEWNEKDHPRGQPGNAGQFAKGSSQGGGKAGKPAVVHKGITKLLKEHGYKKSGKKTLNFPSGEETHHQFEHPSGHKINVYPAKTGQQYMTGFNDMSDAFSKGKGTPALAKYLKEKHGEPSTAEPQLETPEAVAEVNEEVQEQQAAAKHKADIENTLQEAGFKQLGDFHGDWVKDKDAVSIYGDGSWKLFSGKGIEHDASGDTVTELKQELAIHGLSAKPEPEAVKEAEKASLADLSPQDATKKVVQNAGFKHDETLFFGAELWKADNGNVFIAEKDGSWKLYENGSSPPMASGKSADDLINNAAFEALHPRGPGGKFSKKPDVEGTTQTLLDNGWILKNGSLDNWSKWTKGSATVEVYPDGQFIVPSHGLSVSGVTGKNAAELYEKVIAPTAEIEKPKGPLGKPLKLGDLVKTGGQKGSNPGGVYKDVEGKEYYVKHIDTAHSKNEMLAAALFAAVGGNTLHYHGVLNGQELNVATDFENLAADNLSQLTSTQKMQARKDFALHAWLANWDAVGLSGDNIGVANGKVLPLDFGGSLLYRAKGAPKGSAFDDTASEWETLRSQYKNPMAASLYGSMSPEELKESADRLKAIPDKLILELTEAIGPGDAKERANLAAKLMKRKQAILAKANGYTIQQAAPPKPAEPQYASPLHTSNHSWNDEYVARVKAAPKATEKQKQAIGTYSGGSYDPWNKALRQSFGYNSGNYPTEAFASWLRSASFPEDATVTRKVDDNFARHLIDEGHEGHTFIDHGFSSSDHWHGSLTIRISIPKGAQAAAIGAFSHNPSENEIVIQAGSKYRIDKYDPSTKTMHATLVRSGPEKSGIWHVNKETLK